MAIETAPVGGANRRPAARYQPLSSGRPQDPTLQEQAAAMAKQKAMAKGEELATPYLDDLFTSGVDKVKGFFNPVSTPAVTQAAPLAEGATMAEVAAGAGGNAIGTVGTGLTEAAAANAATGAAGTGAMAGLGAAVPYIGAAMLAGKAFGLFNKGGYVNGPLSNVAYKNDGGNIRGIEQSLATGKRQDMSKGPLGLLDLFSKGIDLLTTYDRDNEVRADLPRAKENMFINKRRNPYTGEYPITEEEYQRVMGKEPVNLSMGGMTNPLSKVRYKQSGGPVNEEIEVSYGGPLSKGV